MKKKSKRQLFLALGLLLSIIACNEADKKEEPAAPTESTKTETETVPPVAQDAVPDAINAAPELYKVLNDTLGIKIVEATYKPGDSSALHAHSDYAIYTVAGGTATFYGKDGTKMENEMKTGMTNIRPGEIHAVKNTGKTTLKVILFEVNRQGQITPQDAATDATKVAAGMYKLKNDTLGIRVIEINYKPGQSSAMHSHGGQAVYVIQGGKTEFTGEDGKKAVMEFKGGMTMVVPGVPHSAKNIGTTTLKAILVEVNRAM